MNPPQMRGKPVKPRMFAIIAVVFWSTAATAFKLSLRVLSPYILVLTASTVSLSVLWLLVLFRKRDGGVNILSRSRLTGAAARGLLNPFLYYLVLLNAYNELPAQIAMVINYLWPIVLMLLSVPLLRQKINSKVLAASGLSFMGIAVLALGSNPTGGNLPLFPMCLALLSTIVWAAFWILNLRTPGNAVINLTESFSFGVFYLIVFGIVTGSISQIVQLSFVGIAGAAYIGIFEMGITFVIWNRALELADTTAEVSSYIYLTPFLALVFIGTAVGERIGLATIGGLLLVTTGIILQERFRKRIPTD